MNRFRLFMAGRNGFDRYGMTLLMLALVLASWPFGWLPALPVLGYAMFRMLSRNLVRRRVELQKHDAVMMRIALFLRPAYLGLFRLLGSAGRKGREIATRFRQRRTHVFPACPKCRKRLRLPRGLGTLEVDCPVCGHRFRKKT